MSAVGKIAFALIFTILASLLSACGQSSESLSEDTRQKTPSKPETTAGDEANRLAGTEWTLRTLRGEPAITNVAVTLEMDRNEYGGFAGCNYYGGDYESDRGTLKVFGGDMTDMGNISNVVCKQEETYMNTLLQAASYRIRGDRLELRDSSGETILEYTRKPQWESDPAELINTQWKLSSLDGESPEEGSTPTLSFGTEGRYSGYDGCRNFTGLYAATENTLDFSEIIMNDLGCMKPPNPDGSGGVVGSIPADGNYRLSEDRLEIHAIDGSTYTFVPLTGEDEVKQATVPWKLEKFVENGDATPVLENTEVTITFNGGNLRKTGTVRGSAGCNKYAADYLYRSYQNDVEGLNFSDFAVTKKLCRSPEGIMEQENRYLNFLAGVKGYYKADGRLYLEAAGGRKLVFSGSG